MDERGRPRRNVSTVRYLEESPRQTPYSERALRSRRHDSQGEWPQERSPTRSSRRNGGERRRYEEFAPAADEEDGEEEEEHFRAEPRPQSRKERKASRRAAAAAAAAAAEPLEAEEDADGVDAEAPEQDPHAALRGRAPNARRGGGRGASARAILDSDEEAALAVRPADASQPEQEDQGEERPARAAPRQAKAMRGAGSRREGARAGSAGATPPAKRARRAPPGAPADGSDDFRADEDADDDADADEEEGEGEESESEPSEPESSEDEDEDEEELAPRRRLRSTRGRDAAPAKRTRHNVSRYSPRREDAREQLAANGGAYAAGAGAHAPRQKRHDGDEPWRVAAAAAGGTRGWAPGAAAACATIASGAPLPLLSAPSALNAGGLATPGARGLEREQRGGGGAEVTPLAVDPSLTFESVGGLQRYVAALKEMVFLPLLYPEVFERFQLTPPRGVLLYGPPGTGKTLLARALAASCTRAGAKVSFFMRKGADILSKWVGESERQLRLLFEEAQRVQPSIIFFDEIDGLAPCRSAKSDQIHNSLVSTLLALMDGLDGRGKVVVIGATNRVDALDSALRRPGRFDRELAFPLPNAAARSEILRIHTRGWAQQPPDALLQRLSDSAVGFCGADLKALATEAAVRALRRRYPQIYDSDAKLAIDAASVSVSPADWDAARAGIVPAAHRGAAAHGRPLPPSVAPLLRGALGAALAALGRLFPPAAAAGIAGAQGAAPGAAAAPGARRWVPLGMRLASAESEEDEEEGDEGAATLDEDARAVAAILASSAPLSRRPRLLLCGPAGAGQAAVAAALLHALEAFPVHALSLPALLSDSGARAPEEALVAAVAEARRAAPAVLYLPHLRSWWDAAGPLLRATLCMLLEDVPADLPLLLLATADVAVEELAEEAQALFSADQLVSHQAPQEPHRAAFWAATLGAAAAGCARRRRRRRAARAPPPQLALAPPSEQAQAQQLQQAAAVAAAASADSRALRTFFRDALASLLPDRRWRDFWAQPSEEAFPGWKAAVGSNPMDLTRMLGRVNEGRLRTVRAFLDDAALIPAALSAFFAAGRGGEEREEALLVSRAYALVDHLEALTAQLDPQLVARCDAQEQRAHGGAAHAPAQRSLGLGTPAAGAPSGRGGRSAAVEPLVSDVRPGRAPDPEEIARQVRAAKRLEEQRLRAQQDEAAAGEAAAQATAAAELAAADAARAEAAAAAAAAAPAAEVEEEEEPGELTDEDEAAAMPARVAALAAQLTRATRGMLACELEEAAARVGDAVRALPPRPGRALALDAARTVAAQLEHEQGEAMA